MSIKEIKDAMDNGKVVFGIRQALKLSNGKKKPKIFIVNDTREETIKKLEEKKLKVEVLRQVSKEDVSKELVLDFESEVFSIK